MQISAHQLDETLRKVQRARRCLRALRFYVTDLSHLIVVDFYVVQASL